MSGTYHWQGPLNEISRRHARLAQDRVASHRSKGHDAYRVHEKGMAQAKDRDIVALAIREQRIILTMDLDFPALIARSGESTPSAIIFRIFDETHENVNRLLDKVLPQVESELASGALVIIEDDRFRVRALPIERKDE